MLFLAALGFLSTVVSQECNPTPGTGIFACLTFFSNSACANPTTEASIVAVRDGVCNLVPSSFAGTNFSSWRTTCNAENTGGITVYCASANCAPDSCTARSFNNDDCQSSTHLNSVHSAAGPQSNRPPLTTTRRAPPPPADNPGFGSASLATQCVGTAPASAGAVATALSALAAVATVGAALAGAV